MVRLRKINRWMSLMSLMLVLLVVFAPNSGERLVGSQNVELINEPRISASVTISSAGDYVTQGASGAGTAGDPYVIQNKIYNAEAGLYAVSIQGVSSYAVFRNVTFYGTTLDNLVDPDLGIYRYDIAAVQILNSGNIKFENCTFRNSFSGIYISGSSALIEINNNTFRSLSYAGIYAIGTLSRIDVTNNRMFDIGSYGINMATRPSGSLTQFNTIYNINGTGIILKDSTGTTVYNNTLYRISYAAINVLSINTTVISFNYVNQAGKGIYAQNIHNTNVQNNVILNCIEEGIFIDSVGSITLSQNTVTYSNTGILVRNANLGGTANIHSNTANYNQYGIWLTNGISSNVSINTVKFNTLYGLRVTYSSNVVVQSNTVEDNYGVGIDDHSNTQISIYANNILRNQGNGIQVHESLYSNIGVTYQNLIVESGQNGVLMAGQNSTLQNNLIQNSGTNGVSVVDRYNNIIGNAIVNSLQYGIYSDAFGTSITSTNQITNTGKTGIVLLGSNSTISTTTISQTGEHGMWIESSYSSINNNNIYYANLSGIALGGFQNSLAGNILYNSGITLIEYEDPYNMTTHSIPTSNQINNNVNSIPIYYLTNAVGGSISGSYRSVLMVNCNGVTLNSLTLSNGSIGAQIYNSSNIVINGMTASNNRISAIRAVKSNGLTIIGSTISRSGQNNVYIEANDALIDSNTQIHLSNQDGVFVKGDNFIIRNSVVNGSGGNGIQVIGDAATINSTNITSSSQTGVILNGNSHKMNNARIISSGIHAIVLSQSRNSEFQNNFIQTTGDISVIFDSVNTTLFKGNQITTTMRNIFLNHCISTTFENNELYGLGFDFDGNNSQHFGSHIININNLNNKAVQYITNRRSYSIATAPYSQIIVAESNLITIKRIQDLSNTYFSIGVYFSEFVNIEECRIEYDDFAGIVIRNSNEVKVRLSLINHNRGIIGGIYIKDSNNSEIVENSFFNNTNGLYLSNTQYILCWKSTFSTNVGTAIRIQDSIGNAITNNTFSNNQIKTILSVNNREDYYTRNVFENFNQAAIEFQNGYECFAQYNEFRLGYYTAAVTLIDTDYCQITDNTISAFTGGNGIISDANSNLNYIRWNYISSSSNAPMSNAISVLGSNNYIMDNNIQQASNGIYIQGANNYVYKNKMYTCPSGITLSQAPNAIVEQNEIIGSILYAVQFRDNSNYGLATRNAISLCMRTFLVNYSIYVNVSFNRYCNNINSATQRIGVQATELYEEWNSFCLEGEGSSTGDNIIDLTDPENRAYKRASELQWLDDFQAATYKFLYNYGIVIIVISTLAILLATPKGRQVMRDVFRSTSRRKVGF